MSIVHPGGQADDAGVKVRYLIVSNQAHNCVFPNYSWHINCMQVGETVVSVGGTVVYSTAAVVVSWGGRGV